MPSIDDNVDKWNDLASWERGGDEWSDPWGSPEAMWFATILPRIAARLPARRILEIAPGHGRVTAFLLQHCTEYDGVDIAPNCVAACHARFGGQPGARFHVGDGKSLPMLADGTVDFAFSWDSLVHADQAALTGYVTELARVLRLGGHGFLHHSNLGAFAGDAGEVTVDNPHWRDASTSARSVRDACRDAGLSCVAQELIQWGTPYHGDCLTLLRRPAAGETLDPARDPERFENPHMREEIGYCRILSAIYRR